LLSNQMPTILLAATVARKLEFREQKFGNAVGRQINEN
jgi:hypothetical protein